MATMTATAGRTGGLAYNEKFVIFASSLGTIFEWYDFYLYAVLAPFFAALFFPPGNDTAALLSAFATYAAGLLLALVMIGICRESMDVKAFSQWGWRVPFLLSVVLLAFSIYIRLKLNETPIFQKMKEEGKGSKRPLTDSFLRYPNNKYVLLAMLGATAGQGVVWYTGQFYALFFLIITLKVDPLTAYIMIGISLLIGTPYFIWFGWLSDRIGRLKIILGGCLIAALTYFPLFQGLTHYVNPDLEKFQRTNILTVTDEPC